MSFQESWDAIPKPLGGNKKGYKKGFKDGYEACESQVTELKTAFKELADAIGPVLMGGYDRTLLIEKIKEKYKL